MSTTELDLLQGSELTARHQGRILVRFDKIDEPQQKSEELVDVIAKMGTYAPSAWIPEDSVLVSLGAIARSYSPSARRYTMYSNLDMNRLEWSVPVLVLRSTAQALAEAIEGASVGLVGYETAIRGTTPFIQALEWTRQSLSKSLEPGVQSIARALATMSSDSFAEALRSATKLLDLNRRRNAPTATLSREVRDLSGLSTKTLGMIFPVVRESYQRWATGRTTPSEGDVRRLLALRQLFQQLEAQVPSVRDWLLAPISGDGTTTPFDLLTRGRFSDVWDLTRNLPNRQAVSLDSRHGEFVGSIKGSVRGNWESSSLSEEDLDDLSDWDSDSGE